MNDRDEWCRSVFETGHGVVLQCRCCAKLFVRFHGLLLALEDTAFSRLRRVVTQLDRDPFAALSGATVEFRPGAACMLDREQLAHLRDLLEGADLLRGLGP